ncbi:MAG: hypothetical protein AW08_00651 [Candidatus Accumulibacter adjunctus]|uniref:Uncharacterized protein n=1 Tax=Candidatus Accumulibacter adjunctus TaxID=1454001 RepID=A0A011PSU0_9PROT|nr:MAG: hypothetical protein AW08_00651 [Candidatus Accumulibacter adjunctus]
MEVLGIKQQHPRLALRRRGDDVAVKGQVPLAGNLDEAAVAALLATLGRDRSVVARPVVGPDDHLAAVAGRGGIGGDGDFGADKGLRRVAFAALPLVIAADQDRTAARFTGGVEPRLPEQPDAIAEDANLAARAGDIGRRCVELAADADDAAATTVEVDLAIAHGDAARPDDAFDVEDGVEQGITRPGLHDDAAAVGVDPPAVFDEGARHRAIDLVADEAVAVEVDGDFLAGNQAGGAAGGADVAAVDDPRADQRDAAARRRADLAFVAHDAGAGGIGGEHHATGEQVVRVGVEGAGDEVADMDDGALAEHDARRVDQVDRARGADATEDLRGIVAGDAVDGHRARRGLREAHRFVAGDAEGPPVDRGLAAALVDHHARRAAGADGGLPGDDFGVGRQAVGDAAEGGHEGKDDRPQGGAARCFVMIAVLFPIHFAGHGGLPRTAGES